MNKPELNRCLKLLDDGFSLMTVGNNKTPNFLWAKYQTQQISSEEFEKYYNYSGGKFKKDGTEIEPSVGVGLICGYNGLEVIDVDLKILKNKDIRDNFWHDFISFLEDNIDGFKQKFVIVKSMSFGYHILYKCATVDKNKKLAYWPEISEQALIETRGVGGYVWLYSDFVQGKRYADIQEISTEDREILWQCCRVFDKSKKEEPYVKKDVFVEQQQTGLSVIDDYNQRTSVWSVISDSFVVVKNLPDAIALKRIGSDKTFCGSIFKEKDILYIFTTGTIYPNEKGLSAFACYAYKYHFGNYSAAAKKLYADGYGARMKPETKKDFKLSEYKPTITTGKFPIEVFPEQIQDYILQVESTLNASVDYLGCSLLWALSLSVGNTIKIEIKRGWVEAGVLWVGIVGHAGIGKTHNINAMIKPLSDINGREIKKYNQELKRFEDYMSLTKKEKEDFVEVQEPKNAQFIVGDITIEGLMDLQDNNPVAVGINRDELSGFIKDMNKYRQGSDLENYLSCWSNQTMIFTRKVAKNSFVEKAYVPIIGGVQPSILGSLSTEENKENGFIDRWLLCYPDLVVPRYNRREMTEETIQWYSDYLIGFFDYIRNTYVQYSETGILIPHMGRFTAEADREWERIFNKITDLQNSDSENEYMKSILPKQKSYVARFALLLNTLYAYDNNQNPEQICLKAILGAEKLSDYFIMMAKKNKIDNLETQEISNTLRNSNKPDAQSQFIELYKKTKKINISKTAMQLNVTRQTIHNWIKELESAKV